MVKEIRNYCGIALKPFRDARLVRDELAAEALRSIEAWRSNSVVPKQQSAQINALKSASPREKIVH